jgi:PAS domain S-box-containing protein
MGVLRLMQPDTDAVQETLLGEALEYAPVGAIVLDEHGRYLAANRMACQLTGYSRQELLNRGPAALAIDPQRVPERLRALAGGHLDHGTSSIRCSDGSIKTMDYRAGATRSGGLPFFVVVFWERDADAA